jgi:HEAT repeat protein
MKYVFISFADEDREFAEILIHQLKNSGLTVWEDDGIRQVQTNWFLKVEQVIRNACLVIIVMTPTAKRSEAVMYEWIFALGAEVPIILALREEALLHPRLVSLPCIDLTHTPPSWDALLAVVRQIVERSEPHLVSIPLGTPTYIKEAMRALDSANPDDREGAIDNLAQSDHPVAQEILLGALQHPLYDVRILAALAIGQKKEPRAIPGLLEALECDDNAVCRRAIQALGTIGDITTAPPLLVLLREEREGTRHLISNALGYMGADVVPLLDGALADSNVEIRHSIIKALEKIGKAAVPSLIKALHDSDLSIKLYAMNALKNIGDSSACSVLVQILTNTDEAGAMRQHAAEVLGQIGDALVVPHLIMALADKDDTVRQSGGRALRQLGPQAVPALIEARHRATDGDVRRRITAQLRHIGTPEALAAITAKARR